MSGYITDRPLVARAEAALASQNMLNGHRPTSSIASSSFVPVTDRIATSPIHTPLSPASTDYSMIPRHLLSGNPNVSWSNAMPFSTDPSTDPTLSFSFPPDDGTLCSIVGEVPTADALSSTPASNVSSNARDQGRIHIADSRRESCVTPTRIPSRRDVREWNAAQQRAQCSHGEPSNQATPNKGGALDHFRVFAGAVSSTSADVSGVALALADYLAWARKNPEQCHEGMFQIFEARVREIAEMVTNRVVITLEGIAASQTDIPGLENMAKGLKAAMVRGAEEKADYFHSTYDIQNSLENQRGGLGTGRRLDLTLGA